MQDSYTRMVRELAVRKEVRPICCICDEQIPLADAVDFAHVRNGITRTVHYAGGAGDGSYSCWTSTFMHHGQHALRIKRFRY
jgi:hypothetical protein